MPKDPNLQQQKNCHMQKSRHNTEKISLLVLQNSRIGNWSLYTHTYTHTHMVVLESGKFLIAICKLSWQTSYSKFSPTVLPQ